MVNDVILQFKVLIRAIYEEVYYSLHEHNTLS